MVKQGNRVYVIQTEFNHMAFGISKEVPGILNCYASAIGTRGCIRRGQGSLDADLSISMIVSPPA
jgi:hypothetical protein